MFAWQGLVRLAEGAGWQTGGGACVRLRVCLPGRFVRAARSIIDEHKPRVNPKRKDSLAGVENRSETIYWLHASIDENIHNNRNAVGRIS